MRSIIRQTNSSTINYDNIKFNNAKNSNSITNLKVVRPAIKPKSNLIIFNNSLSNIRSSRTSFNNFNEINEKITEIENSNKVPKDNYNNYRRNLYSLKGSSDYSISSVPNKSILLSNINGPIHNTQIIKDNLKTLTNSNFNNYDIQEVPKNNIKKSYNLTTNMDQKGLYKYSSTPSLISTEQNTNSFYQQNKSQNQNNILQNQKILNIKKKINSINLRYPLQQEINQNPNIGNNLDQINKSHLKTEYQSISQSSNIEYKDFNSRKIKVPKADNIKIKHSSSQNPLVSQDFINNQQELLSQQRLQEQQIIQLQKNLEEQKRFLDQKRSQILKLKQKTKNQLSPQIRMKNINPIFKNEIQGNYDNSIINKKYLKKKSPLSQSHNLMNKKFQSINTYQQKLSEPISTKRNHKNQILMPHSLKQSLSQKIIKKNPSFKNEITEQQIKLAQMASLQNIQNPTNFNASTVSLSRKFLDKEGNEETQSQYERDQDTPIEEIVAKENRKLQQKKLQRKKKLQKQKKNPVNEADIFENLYRTEEGLVIFRNGLLHGIIHKFAEITDVVSKIQIMFCSGVKFTLLYRASEHGDSAKIFHEKCDKHQMTLVLVETTKGVRFGGFTTQNWDGNCIKKIDNNAFVFSLDRHKIYNVQKNEFAIGGYPKFGPVFFGCQIRIYDEFFKKGGTTCHRRLNYNTKVDFELNNGEQSYIVKEIEVYEVEVIKIN